MTDKWRVILAAILLLRAAHAHDPFEITTVGHVRADAFMLEITMARSTALAATRGVREAPTFEPAEFARFQPQFIARAPALYAVMANGVVLAPRRVAAGLGIENDVEFRLEYPRPSAKTVRLEARYLAPLGYGFGDVLSVRQEDGPLLGEKLLDSGDPALAVELPVVAVPPLRRIGAAVTALALVGGLCWWRRREIFGVAEPGRPDGDLEPRCPHRAFHSKTQPARRGRRGSICGKLRGVQTIGFAVFGVVALGVAYSVVSRERESAHERVVPTAPRETPPPRVARREAPVSPPVSAVDPVSRDADLAEALQDLAAGDGQGLATRMESLAEGERVRLISALLLVAARNPGEAVRLAHVFCRADPPGAADYGYALVAALARGGDFRAALEFVCGESGLPNESENPGKWARAVFVAWTERQPETAAWAAAGLQSQSLREEALESVARTWTQRDPVAAGAFMTQQSAGPARDALVAALQTARPE